MNETTAVTAEAAASDTLAAVADPNLGPVGDARVAYLAGLAEGMARGYQLGVGRLHQALTAAVRKSGR